MASSKIDSPGMDGPVTSITTADLDAPMSVPRPVDAEASGAGGVPQPAGTTPTARAMDRGTADPQVDKGTGVEGEVDLWKARYSPKNFVARIFVRVLATALWLFLADYTWNRGHENMVVPTWILAAMLGIWWLTLIYRMILAHFSHYYRLTNRRLFVSSGVFRRHREMMELLHVKDVSTRQQNLSERWLGLGTVVVVPDEAKLPTLVILGVDDPKAVMDRIWHQARTEREGRAVEVDHV